MVQGVEFNTLAREWRCKWAAGEAKDVATLKVLQDLIVAKLPAIKVRPQWETSCLQTTALVHSLALTQLRNNQHLAPTTSHHTKHLSHTHSLFPPPARSRSLARSIFTFFSSSSSSSHLLLLHPGLVICSSFRL
jgi:hypothetical protein